MVGIIRRVAVPHNRSYWFLPRFNIAPGLC